MTSYDVIRNWDPLYCNWSYVLSCVVENVCSTSDLRLHFAPKARRGYELDPYADASFDTCPDTSRSRTGNIVMFCNCPILWTAVYQQFVVLSVAEAELAALCRTAKEVVWLRRILADLGFPQSGPTAIHCDNTAAITLASNNIATRPRTKHILRRFRFIKELIENKTVRCIKIAGKANPADFFTKVLSRRLFIKGRDQYLKWEGTQRRDRSLLNVKTAVCRIHDRNMFSDRYISCLSY